MPELPEVEVCRRGIAPDLEGAVIRGFRARCGRLRLPLPADLPDILPGLRITAVERRAKYLLLRCTGTETDGWLIVHLGMTGNLRFVAHNTRPEKHDHWDLFGEAFCLRYSDPRRFGLLAWHEGDTVERHPLLAGLGVEPLSGDFTPAWLHENLRGRSAPIKTALMDGRLVVGIGNIYAAESLFRAGISPVRAAGRISRDRLAILVDAIRATLRQAIDAGGSSIRDYVHSDGGAGCFQVECAVYDRAGQACRRCGAEVRQIRQAGRSTYYCPGCQR